LREVSHALSVTAPDYGLFSKSLFGKIFYVTLLLAKTMPKLLQYKKIVLHILHYNENGLKWHRATISKICAKILGEISARRGVASQIGGIYYKLTHYTTITNTSTHNY
jgi:hypothetical protein